MRNFYLLMILVLIVAGSCKKSSNSDNSVVTPKIKSILYSDSTGKVLMTENMTYDAEGRVLSASLTFSANPSSSFVVHFEYFPAKIISKVYESWSTPEYISTYELNGAGLATKCLEVRYDSLGHSTGDSTFYAWEYDPNNFMIRSSSFYSYDSTGLAVSTYQIDGGNVSWTVETTGGTTSTTSYEYYPNTVNTIGNRNMGIVFEGTSSVNLVKAEHQGTYVKQYTYQYDSQGRVSEQQMQYSTGETYFSRYAYY
ncbi:MAG TPA: hypothetical protein VMC08_03955 [Bacteroidales bacterium]|nr:hypothetical protein [Bacteroidales bacterium]